MTILDKITQAPWVINTDSPITNVYCDDATESRIAKCSHEYCTLPGSERVANAKAISKVPQLLSIIERLANGSFNEIALAITNAKQIWEELNKEHLYNNDATSTH